MLKIAFVTETHPPEVNGVAMTVGRLVGGLRERGHRFGLAVIDKRQIGPVGGQHLCHAIADPAARPQNQYATLWKQRFCLHVRAFYYW